MQVQWQYMGMVCMCLISGSACACRRALKCVPSIFGLVTANPLLDEAGDSPGRETAGDSYGHETASITVFDVTGGANLSCV